MNDNKLFITLIIAFVIGVLVGIAKIGNLKMVGRVGKYTKMHWLQVRLANRKKSKIYYYQKKYLSKNKFL
jgi:hypothetical protein